MQFKHTNGKIYQILAFDTCSQYALVAQLNEGPATYIVVHQLLIEACSWASGTYFETNKTAAYAYFVEKAFKTMSDKERFIMIVKHEKNEYSAQEFDLLYETYLKSDQFTGLMDPDMIENIEITAFIDHVRDINPNISRNIAADMFDMYVDDEEIPSILDITEDHIDVWIGGIYG